MIKIAVTGGKGGTGKSTIAVNLAAYLTIKGFKVVLADLDVEGCVDNLLLNAEVTSSSKIKVMIPYVIYGKCSACGLCVKVCDTGALISVKGGKPFLIPRLCSGCGACYYACREGAILKGWRVVGEVIRGIARIPVGSEGFRELVIITGRLREGEEHVAPAVIASREEALSVGGRLGAHAVIVDTGAGTGIHVSAALSAADLAIAVSEPTPLGAHDLRSILEVTERLGIPSWVVINKSGIAPEDEVLKVCREFGVDVVARFPYGRCVVNSYVSGRPAVISDSCHSFIRGIELLASKLINSYLGGLNGS